MNSIQWDRGGNWIIYFLHFLCVIFDLIFSFFHLFRFPLRGQLRRTCKATSFHHHHHHHHFVFFFLEIFNYFHRIFN